MSEPLRVGVVGVGWGSAVQVPAFRSVPGFEVVALCARTLDRLEAVGEKLGIADRSTSWEQLIQRDDLDVISVCVPVPMHHVIAIAALRAGKHVLCEKPLAIDIESAEAMALEAQRSGLGNAVCFQNRWSPEKLCVTDLLAGGVLGAPYLCQVTATADYWHPTRGLQAPWMYRLAEGGGYLLGLASHEIDFACSAFGEPEAVCAEVRTSEPRRSTPDGPDMVVDADDTSVVLMRMADGPLVSVSTTVMGLHTRDQYRFAAFGSEGTITIDGTLFGGEVRAGTTGDEEMRTVPLEAREPPRPDAIGTRKAAVPARALGLMLAEWETALRGGASSAVPSFADGLRVQRVIDAARRSSAGAGWVTLPASG